MKKNVLKKTLAILLISAASFGNAQSWEVIATDATGDGNSSPLLDGTELAYWYQEAADSLWFKITCAGMTTAQSGNVGINVMVNYPGGGSTFDFWGFDNGNPFHRLVTGWVTGSAPSTYAGTVGIANSAGVGSSSYTNLFSNNMNITVNVAEATIVVGMKRSDLIPDSALNVDINTSAAVGSSSSWNDDIHSGSGTMKLTTTVGIDESPEKVNETLIYPNPAKDQIYVVPTSEYSNNAEIVITDLAGKVHMQSYLGNGIVDISSLPSGLYFVSVNTENGESISVNKLIKE